MATPIPRDESDRLGILHQYEILDTIAEQAFDDLTALAAAICGTPIALITLVDEDRQWFKSKIGLSPQETPRDIAFCAHTIMGSEIMQVNDATADERFAQNPLVTGDPAIRFYAGAPLLTPEHHAIGSLCVIDRMPRKLTTEQQRALEALSQQVVSMLELRRALLNISKLQRQADEANQRLRLLESAVRQTSDSVLITDSNLERPGPKIVYVNPAFTEMTGYSPEEAVGETPRILQGTKTDRKLLNRLREQLTNGKRFEGETINYRKDGTEFAIEWAVAPVRNGDGEATNFVATQRDITRRKQIADALRRSRDELEARVKERTRELEEANANLREEMVARERTAEALRASQEQLFQAQKMEVLGQLAGGIAHDFNNVLTAIMGYGAILLEELPESQREESKVSEILRAGQRAASLSRQLLTFSRHEAPQQTVLSVSSVIVNMTKMLRQAVGGRIMLEIDVPDELGAVKANAG